MSSATKPEEGLGNGLQEEERRNQQVAEQSEDKRGSGPPPQLRLAPDTLPKDRRKAGLPNDLPNSSNSLNHSHQ